MFLWAWIALFLVIYYTIKYIVTDKRASSTTAQRILSAYHIVLLTLVLVFTIMASIRLDDHYADWPLVFIPFWLMLGLMIAFLPLFVRFTEE